ncbi:tyrosine-type recombinase/integrase [Roseibium sp. RKSG952]|uniref:tyrosine-type recombinase/integrase n=1 Tax=Roseibium sp. RKSG952 TaxID=2529384 RepID=UPI0012BC125B|nr:tyrosine-type recombinase/integrase [Roseibium sp. RKSG952]MTH96535.1 hypothetical protein [Roseibium sp. RKSG952]
MTKVRLKGLSVYQRRGKWYAYIRANRKALVKGFEGSRADLDKHLSTPAILKLYGELAEQPKQRGFGTLGGLFEYYKTKDRWKNLAPRTQADYQKVMDWLSDKGRFKTPVISITPADMAKTRDRAAEDRYPKFSNDALACLSAAFAVGVEYGYAGLTVNPVLGIRRAHKNSKSANRRWTVAEWSGVWRIASPHLRPVLALAKWAGMRGQDIAVLRWDNITRIGEHGSFIEYTALKNGEDCLIAVLPDLDAALQSEKKATLTICKNSRGRPYPSENAMRKAWQDFKASAVFKEAVPTGSDLTLHGLRVTYASELEELGFSDEDKAKAIGDKSASMGKHYGRDAAKVKFALRVKNAKSS